METEVREQFQKFKSYLETVDPDLAKKINVDEMVERHFNPPSKEEVSENIPEEEEQSSPEPSMFDFLFQRVVIDVPSWVVVAVSVVVRLL